VALARESPGARTHSRAWSLQDLDHWLFGRAARRLAKYRPARGGERRKVTVPAAHTVEL
jgi:hypothetical protein